MGVKVVGFKELIHKLKRIELETPVATAFGMYEGMQDIMEDAKLRAPKDTTAMARSGYVTPPDIRVGSDVNVQSGFGGLSEEYVVRVHEDLNMNHPRGGEAKFFSNAIDAGRGRLLDTIQRHVSRYLKTGRNMPVPKRVPASPTEDVP